MSHVAQYGENCKSWDEACDTVNGASQQSVPKHGEKNSPVRKNFKNQMGIVFTISPPSLVHNWMHL